MESILFDHPSTEPGTIKETYGFSSEMIPPQSQDLIHFENDLYLLIKNIEFKDHPRNAFQRKLRDDVQAIKRSTELFVPADKTTNIYKMSKGQYDKLLTENVSAKYKKTDSKIKQEIDREAKKIANNLSLADRAECFASRNHSQGS